MSNYATKIDLKNATGVNTFNLAAKSDLASFVFKKVDKIDVGKLKIAPVDLSKLSNLRENDAVKKTVYNEKNNLKINWY